MKKKKLIIDRTFNAPIDKVWAAFTNPEILAKWWSPAGMKNYHASTNVRVGGEFRYCFESSEGVRYWGKGVYQTINEPTYLSYIDNFTDSDGTPVPQTAASIDAGCLCPCAGSSNESAQPRRQRMINCLLPISSALSSCRRFQMR